MKLIKDEAEVSKCKLFMIPNFSQVLCMPVNCSRIQFWIFQLHHWLLTALCYKGKINCMHKTCIISCKCKKGLMNNHLMQQVLSLPYFLISILLTWTVMRPCDDYKYCSHDNDGGCGVGVGISVAMVMVISMLMMITIIIRRRRRRRIRIMRRMRRRELIQILCS